MLINAHVNSLIEEKQCIVFLVVCVLLGRTLGWTILQKVFNILTFTVKLVSQAEHVSVQDKQTWAGSSSVM